MIYASVYGCWNRIRAIFLFFSVATRSIKTDISLYLLPVHKLKWLHTTGLFNYKPVIVYGPPHNLYRSFIAGCSDYLKDPWDEHELVARAERLLDGVAMEYPWGVVTLRSGTLTGPRGAVALQPYQVTILKTLCRFRGSKVNREVLAHLIWGENRPASRAIDMHMANLRRKMKTVLPEQVRTVILTCRPGGYMLR